MPDEKGRILNIYRDGRRYTARRSVQLPTGAEANLFTLSVMATIVREDAASEDLKRFAMREVIGGFENSTVSEQMDAAYRFCRDRIKYLPESDTTETVADLWSCLYALDAKGPVGDCAIKSVALATLFCYLNVEKPYFVAIRQIQGVDFFNHVFVGVEFGGKELGFDPTPENFSPGDQLSYYQRWKVPIFRK